MAGPRVHVLMYHSISEAGGPTSIPPHVFAMQMRELGHAGYKVITVDEFVDWREGRIELPAKACLITFDDGFADFHEAAAPILKDAGYSAVVFLPTAHLGGTDAWEGGDRPLMGWDRIEALAKDGFEFGGHGVNHVRLTGLTPEALTDEVATSGAVVAQKLGKPTASFAPPYGATDPAARAEMGRHYRAAFGVGFDRARRDCDLYDVPRIEMHYFRDELRWREFLEGRSDIYFAIRKGLRSLREKLGR